MSPAGWKLVLSLMAALAAAAMAMPAAADAASMAPGEARSALTARRMPFTPAGLYAAAAAGEHEAVDLFLVAGMAPDTRHDGRAAWVEAALQGHTAVVRRFLEAGIDIAAGFAQNTGVHSSMEKSGTQAAVLLVLNKTGVRGEEILAFSRRITRRELEHVRNSLARFKRTYGKLPGPTGGLVSADFLLASFDPGRWGVFPVTDGWGYRMLYESDGERYRLVSRGRDGLLDAEEQGVLRAAGDPDRDVVVDNGEFLP